MHSLHFVWYLGLSVIATGLTLPRIFSGSEDVVNDMSFTQLHDQVIVSTYSESPATWVVLLYGGFCPHCRAFGPTYIEAARSLRPLSKVEFGAVDLHTIENRNAIQYFGATFVPLLIILRPIQGPDGLYRMKQSKEPIGQTNTFIARLRTTLGLNTPPTTSTTSTTSLPVQPLPSWAIHFRASDARQDASTYLAIILNIEVFRGNTTHLSIHELGPLMTLLETCTETMLNDVLVKECYDLHLALCTRAGNVGISIEDWDSLLENTTLFTRNIASNPVFLSCTTSSCAFWRFLHIVSLGLGGKSRLSPAEGMSRIRLIVDRFFSCQHCRDHFLDGFDRCLYGRCNKVPEWKDVTLWLWRFHNGASSRILGEPIYWPPLATCPKCYTGYTNTVFDEAKVYEYLLSVLGVRSETQVEYIKQLATTSTTKGYYFPPYHFVIMYMAPYWGADLRTVHVKQAWNFLDVDAIMLVYKPLLLVLGLVTACRSDDVDLLYEGKTAFVAELNVTKFNEMVMGDMTDRTWIVVFYAHWCGHCQAFSHTYMALAESMAEHDQHIRFGAVDCASTSSAKLDDEDICAGNDIRLFPSVLEYKRGVMMRDLPLEIEDLQKTVIVTLKDAGVPIESIPNASIIHDAHTGDAHMSTLPQDPASVLFDAELAMRTILSDFIFQGGSKHLDETRREYLKHLLYLCSRIRISDAGRKGCLDVKTYVDRFHGLSPKVLKRVLIDSSMTKQKGRFQSCKSFSCGLWRLFHLITVSIEPDNEMVTMLQPHIPIATRSESAIAAYPLLNATEAMSSIRFIVDQYFQCTVCRKHFLGHYDACDFNRCTESPSPMNVPFWLWNLHNGVNTRLENAQWPNEKFNEHLTPVDVVLALRSLYGLGELVSSKPSLTASLHFGLVGFTVIGFVYMLYKLATIRMVVNRFKSQFTKKYQPIV